MTITSPDAAGSNPDGLVARAIALGRKLAGEGLRYFVASAAALAVDYAILVGATELLGVHYLVSAALGFSAGLVVNYLLSVLWVFKERRLKNRWIEAAGFAAIGVMGLGLNEGLMALFVEAIGLPYALAKIPATGVGFLFNYGVRRILLFTKGARPAAKIASAAEPVKAA